EILRCGGASSAGSGAVRRLTYTEVGGRQPVCKGIRRGIDLIRKRLQRWPVARQLAQQDPVALGDSARSANHVGVRPRTATADRVVRSICLYCAVGCGQRVYVKDE